MISTLHGIPTSSALIHRILAAASTHWSSRVVFAAPFCIIRLVIFLQTAFACAAWHSEVQEVQAVVKITTSGSTEMLGFVS
jgi:hypothetical protein